MLTHTCIHMFIYTCIHTCMHILIHTCTHAHTYTHTYIHTYTYTYIQSKQDGCLLAYNPKYLTLLSHEPINFNNISGFVKHKHLQEKYIRVTTLHTFIHTYICMYTHTHIYIYIYMQINIHVYTMYVE